MIPYAAIILLVLTLAACAHPADNIGAAMRSWCASQPHCDVNEAR